MVDETSPKKTVNTYLTWYISYTLASVNGQTFVVLHKIAKKKKKSRCNLRGGGIG